MLYFERNGSELSTRISEQKKYLGVKRIAPLERAGKNLLTYVFCYFLRKSKYDYDLIIPSKSVWRVRAQHKELARPLAAVFLILLLLSPLFLQFENLG